MQNRTQILNALDKARNTLNKIPVSGRGLYHAAIEALERAMRIIVDDVRDSEEDQKKRAGV